MIHAVADETQSQVHLAGDDQCKAKVLWIEFLSHLANTRATEADLLLAHPDALPRSRRAFLLCKHCGQTLVCYRGMDWSSHEELGRSAP